MKHYRLKGTSTPAKPALLFEVRLHLQDVRSGYRNADYGFFSGEWLEDSDLQWTQDMVSRLEPEQLEKTAPPYSVSWPETGDQKLIYYLVRHYRPRLLRNDALNLYCLPMESREEFIQRCHQILHEEKLEELRTLSEVFLHRFLALEQQWLEATSEESSDGWVYQHHDQIRAFFSVIREDLSRCILHTREVSPDDFNWTVVADPEFEERVKSLRDEFIALFNRIVIECDQKASQVVNYEVPLSYPQIEIVSRAVLWN